MNDYLVNLARRGAGLAPTQLTRLAYEPSFMADDALSEASHVGEVGEFGQSAQMPGQTLSPITTVRIEQEPMAEPRPIMLVPIAEPARPVSQTIMRAPRKDDSFAPLHPARASGVTVGSPLASPRETETRGTLNQTQSMQIKSASESGVRPRQEFFVSHVDAPRAASSAASSVVAHASQSVTKVVPQPHTPTPLAQAAQSETTESGALAYVAPTVADLPELAASEPSATEGEAPRIEVRIGRIEMRVNTPPVVAPRPAVERPRGFAGYERARRGENRDWY